MNREILILVGIFLTAINPIHVQGQLEPPPLCPLNRGVALKCPPTGNSKIPHESDCTKFFHCVEGAEFPDRCSAGLLFDFLTLSCKLAQEASCYGGATTPSPDHICSKAGATLCRAPHPYDCRKYYECENGAVTQEKECDAGKGFDPSIRDCVERDDDKCYIGATFPPVPTTTTQAMPSFPPEFCPIVGGANRPHPWDCSKYYVCINGFPTGPVSCPKGELYDVEREECVTAAEAKCSDGATTPPPSDPCLDESAEEVVFRPHPYNCRKYYLCPGGGKPGHIFNCTLARAVPSLRGPCHLQQQRHLL
jgi:hypothetical protein